MREEKIKFTINNNGHYIRLFVMTSFHRKLEWNDTLMLLHNTYVSEKKMQAAKKSQHQLNRQKEVIIEKKKKTNCICKQQATNSTKCNLDLVHWLWSEIEWKNWNSNDFFFFYFRGTTNRFVYNWISISLSNWIECWLNFVNFTPCEWIVFMLEHYMIDIIWNL